VDSYTYFLQADLSQYIDEWVAIFKEKVIAHGKDVQTLYQKVERESDVRKVLFVKVPGKSAMIL
jgi:hypothetical protein